MSTRKLIPDQAMADYGDPTPRDIVGETDGAACHAAKVRRSALWAAYGDALGWISELTDEAGLKRRTAGEPLCRPIAWKRRIGGRSGVIASLPAGCYSDDTQLRLATGRAIHPGGFDVEAFAGVELPVWLSYALGGGKSTTAAAVNLGKPRVAWFANTFKGWTESGGNGAAMRIQPHVWSARTPDNPESFLPDVIRNAICTHSHPTGIMGAVIHAVTLAHTISTGRAPSPDDLGMAITVAENLPALMRNDFEVWNYWRTAYEREAGLFGKAWEQAIEDSRDALRIASVNHPGLTGAESYTAIVDSLMLRERQHIGNGILTAIAAVGLAWCETQPAEALRIAANTVGTDTDTIATMAGAILGATDEADPPVEVLDADLLRSEAIRLSTIAQGGHPQGHQYPDLLHWSAPKTRSDALTLAKNGDLCVSGLGLAYAIEDPISSPQGGFQWQWVDTELGQTLLIKRRVVLTQNDVTDAVSANLSPPDTSLTPATGNATSETPIDLEAALDYIAAHIRDSEAIGKSLRNVVYRGTRGQIAAFTAALVDLIREDREATVGHDGHGNI